MECAQSNGAGAVLCPPAFQREPGASQNGKPSESPPGSEAGKGRGRVWAAPTPSCSAH